jgi:hypothetical protein
VDSGWLCVVINKNLCVRGVEAVTQEIKRLAGDSFMDFRIVDDGYEGDSYSFIKCRLMGNYMEKFRGSPNVVSVLDSYDSPVYLGDEEVEQFIIDDSQDEVKQFVYGDMVLVGGEGPFSGLKGVVVGSEQLQSEVVFRFHTLSLRRWLLNEELILTGNVFSCLKLPVTDISFLQKRGKFPVMEKRGVSSGKPNRVPDRKGKQDEM